MPFDTESICQQFFYSFNINHEHLCTIFWLVLLTSEIKTPDEIYSCYRGELIYCYTCYTKVYLYVVFEKEYIILKWDLSFT